MSALTIIIFGATGDLTSRKLVPALYRLFSKGRLPAEAQIVGVARTPLSHEAFRDRMAKALQEFAADDWQAQRWQEFSRRLFYAAGDAAHAGGLDQLQAWLREAESAGGGRRLYYLAVAPQLYAGIVTRLGEAGMSREDGGFRRLVIEKPFG